MIRPDVLLIKVIEFIAEILGHSWCFTQNLTSQSLNLFNSAGSSFLLLHWEIVSKLELILLFQEVNKELAATEYFRFYDRS